MRHDPIEATLRVASTLEDSEAFARLIVAAFAVPDADARAWPAQLELGNVRLFESPRSKPSTTTAVLGGLAFYPMGQYFGGRRVSCTGVAGVAVDPTLRGRGIATAMMNAALGELAERRVALSALYPASLRLYARSGYAVCGDRYEVRVPLDGLPRVAPATSGRLVRLEGVEDASMRACYAAVARHRDGWLDRSEPMWRRVREQRGVVREGYAWMQAERCDAYVWFQRVPRAPLSSDIVCSDLVARDAHAAAQIFGFLASFSTVCKELVFHAAPQDPLLFMLEEFRWRVAHLHPWMVRVVDASAAIAARGFPPPLRGSVDFTLRDDGFAHNRGPFRLSVEGGLGELARGGAGGIEIDIRDFATLYSGRVPASRLAAFGRLRGDERSLAFLDACFQTGPPTTPEMY